MYAIVKTGGKQYKVSAGDVLAVEKLAGNTGDTVVLEDILMVNREGTVAVGQPTLSQAKVTAEIISQTKAKKNIIFKSKRRKGYQKKTGHRQPVTRIKIKEIQIP